MISDWITLYKARGFWPRTIKVIRKSEQAINGAEWWCSSSNAPAEINTKDIYIYIGIGRYKLWNRKAAKVVGP